MGRKLVTASIFIVAIGSLTGCYTAPKLGSQALANAQKADELIASEIGDVRFDNNWYEVEQSFGALIGFDDLMTPRSYASSFCRSQSGKLEKATDARSQIPYSRELSRTKLNWIKANVADSFGTFACMKEDSIEWILEVASTDTYLSDVKTIGFGTEIKTTLLFRSFTLDEKATIEGIEKLAREQEIRERALLAGQRLASRKEDLKSNLSLGKTVCRDLDTSFPGFTLAGSVEEVQGDKIKVNFFMAYNPNAPGQRLPQFRPLAEWGNYWDFGPCTY